MHSQDHEGQALQQYRAATGQDYKDDFEWIPVYYSCRVRALKKFEAAPHVGVLGTGMGGEVL